MNNWSIYCLPRCGSTLAAQLLLAYFKDQDSKFLTYPVQTARQAEWFNPTNINILATRHNINIDKARKLAYTTIQNLAGTDQFPFIKNIITAVPPYTYDFMKQCGYRILAIHRRNIIDQYLSHMVSVRSFYHMSSIVDTRSLPRTEPFEANRDSFDAYNRHYRLLNSYKADAHIYYEDFVNNPSVLFDTIGRVNINIDQYVAAVRTKPIVDDLRQYVTNIDTIKQWFAHELDYYEQ